MIIQKELVRTLSAIDNEQTCQFRRLVEVAGLSPMSDFIGADLRYIILAGDDVSGFNFSGADLRGTFLRYAIGLDKVTISKETSLDYEDVQYLRSIENKNKGKSKMETFGEGFARLDYDCDRLKRAVDSHKFLVTTELYLRQGASANHSLWEALNALVLAYMANGKFIDAIPYAVEALEVEVQSPPDEEKDESFEVISVLNLARCYMQITLYDEALQEWRRALELEYRDGERIISSLPGVELEVLAGKLKCVQALNINDELSSSITEILEYVFDDKTESRIDELKNHIGDHIAFIKSILHEAKNKGFIQIENLQSFIERLDLLENDAV